MDEFAYHHPLHTLWGWPGMSPFMWRDPSGHFESTGAEGWFLRNADDMMEVAGGVAIAAGTIATGGLALAAADSLLIAGGAAGHLALPRLKRFASFEGENLTTHARCMGGMLEGLVTAAGKGLLAGNHSSLYTRHSHAKSFDIVRASPLRQCTHRSLRSPHVEKVTAE